MRRGALVRDDEGDLVLLGDPVDDEQARNLGALQAACGAYRVALGPRAGKKVLTTLKRAMPRQSSGGKRQCAELDGLGLHGGVRFAANERAGLGRLGRYISRPAQADERVRCNDRGLMELELKPPWRDGTTHPVLTPLKFTRRLAALVPRPRQHLIRFHGVLAPKAGLRAAVIPQAPAENAPRAGAQRSVVVAGRPADARRLGWAELLRRVFSLDLECCPWCGQN